jgi:hypothetical protein
MMRPGVYLLVLGLMCFFTPMILAFVEGEGDMVRWLAKLTLQRIFLVRAMMASGLAFIVVGFALITWSLR